MNIRREGWPVGLDDPWSVSVGMTAFSLGTCAPLSTYEGRELAAHEAGQATLWSIPAVSTN